MRPIDTLLCLCALASGAGAQRIASTQETRREVLPSTTVTSQDPAGRAGPEAPEAPEGGGGPTGPRPVRDCAVQLVDCSGGSPLGVSTNPLLGFLRPLSQALMVDGLGRVGIAANDPEAKLYVGSGNTRIDDGVLELYASDPLNPLRLGDFGSGIRLRDASTTIVADPTPRAEFLDGGLGLAASDPTWGPLVEVGIAGGSKLSRIAGAGPNGATLAIDADREGHLIVADDGGAGSWRNDFDLANGALRFFGGLHWDAGTMELLDPSDAPELELRAVDLVSGDGGAAIRARSDAADKRAFELVATTAGGGIALRDTAGELRARVDAETISGGGAELRLWNDNAQTVAVRGQASFANAELELYDQLGRRSLVASAQGANPLLELGAAVNGGSYQETATLEVTSTLTKLALEPTLPGGEPILVSALAGLGTAGGALSIGALGGQRLLVADNGFVLSNSFGDPTIVNDGLTATKSAVVTTVEHGSRRFFCSEAASAWFEDAGRGRTRDGSAQIALDPVFLQTVVIDDAHPYLVEVTPRGSSPGVWVEKQHDRFVVHELPGGTGETAFDWRVQARRVGLADVRLEPFDAGAGLTRVR